MYTKIVIHTETKHILRYGYIYINNKSVNKPCTIIQKWKPKAYLRLNTDQTFEQQQALTKSNITNTEHKVYISDNIQAVT